jgi:hypothetical protein
MKGISKSLFAGQARVRSAMADAAQASMDTLGYARGDSASAVDADAAASAFRRGDDGACDPDASLVLVLEHAVGFDEPSLFAAARVANKEGRLKGARAHTLAARRDDDSFSVETSRDGFDDETGGLLREDDTRRIDNVTLREGGDAPSSSSRAQKKSTSSHVFACRRDLRVTPAPGDCLLIEVYGANDTSRRSSAWATKCVARGSVSLEYLLRESEKGASVRLPCHRALLGEADVFPPYVSVRVLNARGADTRRPPLTVSADVNKTANLLGALIDLDDTSKGSNETVRDGGGGFASFPKTRKRVFFLRHGESRWNEAQREMQLSAMAKFDHPLNAKGATQAVHAGREAARYHAASLRYGVDAADKGASSTKLADDAGASACRSGPDASPPTHPDSATRKQIAWSRSFGDATRCFSSPLTRATQTAALFLFASGALAKTTGPGRLAADTLCLERTDAPLACDETDERFVVLSRSLREVKSTMGSLDTIGIERGSGILHRAAEKLRDACHGGCQPDAAYADDAVVATTRVTDFNDAFGAWWTARDDVDSREATDERVDDFFETLRLEKSDAVIVVGHSLWFQHAVKRLCRREGSRAFCARENDLARKLASEKIGNCACVGVDVAFDARTGEASIEDAAFLFGSGGAGGGEDDA